MRAPIRRIAVVCGALLAALAGTSLVLGVVALHRAPRPALSSAEQAAMTAARRLVVNLTTYRRASFDADFRRALAGTTGPLRAQEIAARAPTRAALTKNKFDITGVVVAVGVESTTARTVVLSVLQDGYRVDAGKQTLTSTNRLEVTMSKVRGQWLLSAIANVPLV